MYPLDLRETNLLRHALRHDGSDRALTLLGSLPAEGVEAHTLEAAEIETAGRALDRYAESKQAFGGMASEIADAMLSRSRSPKPDYGPGRN